jgi:hypothetical protein
VSNDAKQRKCKNTQSVAPVTTTTTHTQSLWLSNSPIGPVRLLFNAMALSMVSHDERSRKQFFHESSRPAGHSSINKNVSFSVLYVLNSNLFGSDDHINEIFLCHYFLVMLSCSWRSFPWRLKTKFAVLRQSIIRFNYGKISWRSILWWKGRNMAQEATKASCSPATNKSDTSVDYKQHQEKSQWWSIYCTKSFQTSHYWMGR